MLTGLFSTAWLVGFVVRLLNPSMSSALGGLDAAVMVMLGYWFTMRRNGRDSGGNGHDV